MDHLKTGELATFSAAVARASALPSSCVPDDAVLISFAGGPQAATVWPHQYERVARLRCLMRRAVTLCFENTTDAFGTCVAAARRLPTNYFKVCWIKWHLLHAALLTARTALYVDADCILLSNPFVAAAPARGLLYQFEGPGANPLNSGQLLSSDAAAVREVLRAEPADADRSTRLDQEIAHDALARAGVPAARLPPAFAGNCWWGPEIVPWCDLVTFHAHCTGTNQEKLERIRLVLRETRHCPGGGATSSASGRAAGRSLQRSTAAWRTRGSPPSIHT